MKMSLTRQVYVLSGVGGSVGTFIFGDAVTVGASSGIFGLIGAPAPCKCPSCIM